MSRLDSFIRRLQAQRACINQAIEMVAALPGVIFELGLGNGRTYHHLRENCPGREIFVFERKVSAHRDSVPDKGHLMEGAIEETLPAAMSRFRHQVAFIHMDLGSGRPEIDTATATFVARHLDDLLARGGVIVADQDIRWPGAEAIALPDGVQPGRIYFYRKA